MCGDTLRLGSWKVTIGLASQWPRDTDISGSSPTGLGLGMEKEMNTRLRSLISLISEV